MDLHVGAPNPVNKGNFFNYLNTALDANWITNFGNLNQNLEKKIAHVHVKHCICVYAMQQLVYSYYIKLLT